MLKNTNKPSFSLVVLVSIKLTIANHLNFQTNNNNNNNFTNNFYEKNLLKHTITQNLNNWAKDTSDMQWEPENEECPPLPQPDDGVLTCSDGFRKKSVCKYECQKGFITSGKSKRRCKCDKDTGRCYKKCLKIVIKIERPCFC